MDTSQAYSVSTFCSRHSISRAMFYKLAKEGNAPKTIKLGRRTLISQEAALEWRQRMESQSS